MSPNNRIAPYGWQPRPHSALGMRSPKDYRRTLLKVRLARIREVVALTRLAPHELRETIRALGHSRCVEALALLRELAIESGTEFQAFATEWIDAIAALGTAESRRILLAFVDPDVGQTGLEPHLEYSHRERIAFRIIDIARSEDGVKERLYVLCAKRLPTPLRLLLADVIARLGTREGLIIGLDLVQSAAPPIVDRLVIINVVANIYDIASDS